VRRSRPEKFRLNESDLKRVGLHRSTPRSPTPQRVHGFGCRAPFVAERLLLAHGEFTGYLEADASGTAHALALRFSPDACQVYKLGAFWGYSALVRAASPGVRTTHAAEIRHYGQMAKLPEGLWQPMTEEAPRESADRLAADTGAFTAGVTNYLGSTR
jgi:hypothetical protein